MALRFVDSFDHYDSDNLQYKWTNNSATIVAGMGRRGTQCLRIGGASTYVIQTLDAQQSWHVGFSFSTTAAPPSTAANMIAVLDAASPQVSLTINPDRTLGYWRENTLLANTTLAIALNTVYYLEFSVFIHSTLGTGRIRINEADWLSLINVNTQFTANASANMIRVGRTSASVWGTQNIDDLYMCDGQGVTNNSLLGDCRADILMPNADGSNSSWTVSSGTSHYSLLSEVLHDADTSYIVSATNGLRDTHQMADLPLLSPHAPIGVQHMLAARSTTGTTPQVRSVLRNAAGTIMLGSAFTLSSTWRYYSTLYASDPAGALWTISAIDTLEAGIDDVTVGTHSVRLTHHVIEVLSAIPSIITAQPHVNVCT
jgi:hypothetical protein